MEIRIGSGLWMSSHLGIQVVRYLVEEGPRGPVETRALANCGNGAALIQAAENGRLQVFRELLEMSINTGHSFTRDQFLQALNAIPNLDGNIRNELEEIFYNVPMLK